MGRPADYLRGLGQWLPAPCNGGTSKRAATPEPAIRRRGGLGPRAAIPKRQLPNCHSCQRGTLKPAWVAHKREGARGPQCSKVRGPKDPGVVAPLASAGCCGICWYDMGGLLHASARSSHSSHFWTRSWRTFLPGPCQLRMLGNLTPQKMRLCAECRAVGSMAVWGLFASSTCYNE